MTTEDAQGNYPPLYNFLMKLKSRMFNLPVEVAPIGKAGSKL